MALTLFGTGLSGYLGLDYVGQQATVVFSKLAVPGLSEIPVLGPVLFRQDLLVYCSYILVAVVAFYLYRTRAGLFMRALGENPAAVDAVGVNVFGLRYLYVIMGRCFSRFGRRVFVAGLCSLLAGKYDGRTRLDRGGTCNFALWDPWRALLGSYLFGGIDALGFHLQVVGLPVSVFILNMLPYIFYNSGFDFGSGPQRGAVWQRLRRWGSLMTGKNVKRGELLWNFLFSYALCLLCLLLWPSWLTDW